MRFYFTFNPILLSYPTFANSKNFFETEAIVLGKSLRVVYQSMKVNAIASQTWDISNPARNP
jgi:hypothetical protein